jgi:hypothetical protein
MPVFRYRRGPLIDPGEIERDTRIPHIARLSQNADLPMLVASLNFHSGIIVAILAALAAYILLWRTVPELRSCIDVCELSKSSTPGWPVLKIPFNYCYQAACVSVYRSRAYQRGASARCQRLAGDPDRGNSFDAGLGIRYTDAGTVVFADRRDDRRVHWCTARTG